MAHNDRFSPRIGWMITFFMAPVSLTIPMVLFIDEPKQLAAGLSMATPFIIFGIFAGLACLLMPMMRKANHQANLLKTGRRATGIIKDMKTTGLRVNKQPEVRFSLSVYAREHDAPYPASADRIISILEIPRYQPGATLALRVNPEDPEDVVIEGLAS